MANLEDRQRKMFRRYPWDKPASVRISAGLKMLGLVLLGVMIAAISIVGVYYLAALELTCYNSALEDCLIHGGNRAVCDIAAQSLCF